MNCGSPGLMQPDPDHLNREFLARMLPSERAIRSFVFSIHPHAGDLDDIMQDTAFSLWQKFGSFDPTREFLPWAMRLAYFEVLRFRKKRSRDRLVFSDELLEVMAEDTSHAGFSEPLRESFEACLARLDPRSRAVLEARYGSGTSIAELAKSRNESVHSLYRLLEQARVTLVAAVRRQLADECGGLTQ